MERLFIIVLIVGLLLGGYNCNRSAEITSEELTTQELDLEYDSMEKEILREEEWIEKQANSLKAGRETEENSFEEDLGD